MNVIYVVIVTHNPKIWVDKCLGSLRQSLCTVRTIVIDNNSSDDSGEYIKKNYLEVDYIQFEENLGFGAANNIGIKKAYEANADYVFLLNQDAWIEPNTIENLIRAHENEPQFGILSPMHLNGRGDALDYNFSIYINPSKCKKIYSDIYLKSLKSKLYEVEFVNAAAWLLTRECIETVGGFNPSFFHYGEDENYVQRTKYKKLRVGVLATCKIFHDRETRTGTNIYFKDELELFKRLLILKVSNPFSDYNFNDEFKKQFKLIIKTILFLRFDMAKKNISKVFLLNRKNKKEIIENKKKSIIEKSAFLNI
ncbi:glycosyltransferase family 2 protein [Flavobacterium granuli]|uniref:GT2 family glycosyltransferase n=1 Tax=Flavobacterium granuli TaxID=280093 RepID=A0ABU1S5V0_9FLAO|nr:glycosyltransferase family 2 protein [Flavobacterium granuli]MDR6846415.1 GT2 family glycosyltransferase [Flavobacterium granuli]